MALFVEKHVCYKSEHFGALQAIGHASAVLVQLIVSFGGQDGHELENPLHNAYYHVYCLLNVFIKTQGVLKSIEGGLNSIELNFVFRNYGTRTAN